MKIFNALKLSGMLVLVVSFAVGCAGTPEEETTGDAAAAIAAAKAANKKAASVHYEWRDTGKLIKKAEAALKAGNDAEAIKLANKARRQAENAYAQKFSEMKRLGFTETTAMEPMHEDMGKMMEASYTVERGDNLWDISAKSSIYGNPYQWPLIYKTNSDKIKDADLIYPGQVLGIEQNASSSEIAAAIQHAKTRGSWTLGVVEESDKAYLAN